MTPQEAIERLLQLPFFLQVNFQTHAVSVITGIEYRARFQQDGLQVVMPPQVIDGGHTPMRNVMLLPGTKIEGLVYYFEAQHRATMKELGTEK